MNRDIISTLSKIGDVFNGILAGEIHSKAAENLLNEVQSAHLYNPWFIPSFTELSLKAWALALEPGKIEQWLVRYPSALDRRPDPAIVAVVMAGNIPMVGLHDLICIIASGHRAMVKLSSADNRLIPAVISLLEELDPGIRGQVMIADHILKGFHAVIATGSNNTSRYFDYYFGRYPHIIRRNRNSIAVVTGDESPDELEALGMDIFSYFGLGCRNVSKVLVPEGYIPEHLFEGFNHYSFLSDHHKYRNNYDYQKSILMINRVPFNDNGFLLLKEDESLISPISVLNYEFYGQGLTAADIISGHQDALQCVISVDDHLKPGQAQYPELWDYADGADVMEFLERIRP
jgi:hypothetical protein